MPHQHFSTPEPSVASEPISFTVAMPDGPLALTTDRGVFSHGALDLGTKVLLLKSPPVPQQGHLLDLGCGS
ncbi:MAG TPA: methyltransferase, partial [Ilumatobacteraceae bacterium]|nr:methyltransferase [Ilumatobacteraceae bacterium]